MSSGSSCCISMSWCKIEKIVKFTSKHNSLRNVSTLWSHRRLLCACMLSCFSLVWLLATPWTVASRLLCPWDSPGKKTGVGCHALLQGILSYLGIEPTSLMSPALAGRFFTANATWEAQRAVSKHNNLRNIFTLWSHRGLPAIVLVIKTTRRRKPETGRNRSNYAQRYRR